MRDRTARGGVDPDVDLHIARQRTETRPRVWDIAVAIALGGALGAVGRYGLSVALPHRTGTVSWSTFATNVSGCLLIGVLMVVLTEIAGHPHRLFRPFLGVGVLGGFTTFSTYTVETRELVAAGAPRLAFGYLLGTLAAALVAVQVGVVVTRLLARARRRRRACGEA